MQKEDKKLAGSSRREMQSCHIHWFELWGQKDHRKDCLATTLINASMLKGVDRLSGNVFIIEPYSWE